MLKYESTPRAPLDISTFVGVARRMLTDNSNSPKHVQDLIGHVHTCELTDFDRLFQNTFATDAELDTITQLIRVSVGYPDDCSAIKHETRCCSALILLQATAGDTSNTAIFLASDDRVHPLLILQSSVHRAQKGDQMISDSILRNIILVLARLHSPLSLFCTEAMRKQVLYRSGNPAYNIEHHAVVAWDVIRRHVFMDATDEASRCQRLQVVLNLDHAGLLAKVVTTLRDVLRPLQQRHDAGQSAKQSPSTSLCDVTKNLDSMVPVNPMHIEGHGFQAPQLSQNQFQKELQLVSSPKPTDFDQALCFSV